ncbi:hypothetical protein [Chromohalobacter israelensis]|uniref:hypothetical protein n=1 Tax=Chromohalobacter israelensis TaxID=141390 RepID=UPI00265BFD13|nr:hypothetical protein [Chromohalobacter salexigens]MDO0947454.1 hypothetical protein [Chromohalobacter salexigens]
MDISGIFKSIALAFLGKPRSAKGTLSRKNKPSTHTPEALNKKSIFPFQKLE